MENHVSLADALRGKPMHAPAGHHFVTMPGSGVVCTVADTPPVTYSGITAFTRPLCGGMLASPVPWRGTHLGAYVECRGCASASAAFAPGGAWAEDPFPETASPAAELVAVHTPWKPLGFGTPALMLDLNAAVERLGIGEVWSILSDLRGEPVELQARDDAGHLQTYTGELVVGSLVRHVEFDIALAEDWDTDERGDRFPLCAWEAEVRIVSGVGLTTDTALSGDPVLIWR